ncbi:hypothetical protein K443DRAFT_679212 [Laccaria amethystina LaAM-08-1]|uniref:Uncharacterized protein n=1 Tax=Laccaria amethystina LaAM-08-1 TaxID=1095629 RepID=A0A0C9XFL9_9AGAR|nr:hypothetical protein K443DRAFT_679212 [Laccaria amethystina LaAM-08-1]
MVAWRAGGNGHWSWSMLCHTLLDPVLVPSVFRYEDSETVSSVLPGLKFPKLLTMRLTCLKNEIISVVTIASETLRNFAFEEK